MSQDATVLYDGECRMCSGWARFVSRRDPGGALGLAPLQSEEGRAMLERHGLPTGDLGTIVFVVEGRALTKSDAVLGILERLRWPWPAAALVRIVPRAFRDAVYDLIARNRLRIFGAQRCEWTPPPPPR